MDNGGEGRKEEEVNPAAFAGGPSGPSWAVAVFRVNGIHRFMDEGKGGGYEGVGRGGRQEGGG